MAKNEDNLMEELLDRINKMELDIATLKQQLAHTQPSYYPPLPVNDFNKCTDGGEHEYPNPWHSILPPHCQKCGKQAPDYSITFMNNSTGNPPWNFNEHGGNVMGTPNQIDFIDKTTTSFFVSEDNSSIS